MLSAPAFIGSDPGSKAHSRWCGDRGIEEAFPIRFASKLNEVVARAAGWVVVHRLSKKVWSAAEALYRLFDEVRFATACRN